MSQINQQRPEVCWIFFFLTQRQWYQKKWGKKYVSFCFCVKHHDWKLGRENDSLQLPAYHLEKSGQELKQRLETETMEEYSLIVHCSSLYLAFCYHPRLGSEWAACWDLLDQLAYRTCRPTQSEQSFYWNTLLKWL